MKLFWCRNQDSSMILDNTFHFQTEKMIWPCEGGAFFCSEIRDFSLFLPRFRDSTSLFPPPFYTYTMSKNKFILASSDIISSDLTTDWSKCFICQIREPKSVTLVNPSNKKGKWFVIYNFVIFSIFFVYIIAI